ncbi:unnamed protein product [Amoebophrya sp. A120]|nr:unnamed protein product [Amoebophrya sp. A120]|eukprot:GSA120T00001914001.1
MNAEQIHGLMGLLGVGNEEEQETSTLPPNAVAAERTAMGYKPRSQARPNMKVSVRQKPKVVEKKAEPIWADTDFKENAGVVIKDDGDDRKVPDYDILFKQDVGSEDVFLNLGQKDGSSDHCHEIVVKIKLPNTELKDITLDVLEQRVLCSSKLYKLNVALPHPVYKDEGNAKWDKLKGVLSVTLPIKTDIKYFSDVSDLVREKEN